MVKKIAYEEFQEWIRELRNQHYGAKNNYLLRREMSSFEAFCKIFHPIYEDLSIKDQKVSWDEYFRSNEQTSNKSEPESNDPEILEIVRESTLSRGWPDGPFQSKRIMWRTLTERYGLNFNEDLCTSTFDRIFPKKSWPRYLVGPQEGELDLDSLNLLCDILRVFTTCHKCFLYSEPWRNRNYEPQVLLGYIQDSLKVVDSGEFYDPPNLWWSADKTWFIETNPDLPYTVAGGSQRFINRIVADSYLEAIEVWPKGVEN